MNLPVIAGIEITTDEEGRFSLNMLHKASGGETNKAPSQWFRTQTASELVAEVEKETMHNCTVSIGGRNGGTFAHELLAVSYAGWISPSFQLKVNQVFLDYRSGKLMPQLPDFNNPIHAARAWADEVEKKQTLQLEVAELAPKAAITDRLMTKTEGNMSIRNSAKAIGVQEKTFVKWLLMNDWLFRNRKGRLEGYAKHIPRHIEHKVTAIPIDGDLDRVSLQPMITPEGLTKLAAIFNGEGLIA